MNLFVRFWACSYLGILLITAVNPVIFDTSLLATVKYLFPILGLIVNILIIVKSSSVYKISTEFQFILGFILLLMISLVVTSDFVESFLRIIFAAISLMYIYTATLLDKRLLESVLQFLYWLSIGIIVWCYYLLVFYPLDYFNSGNFRGIFYNANYLGSILTFASVPAILLRLHSKNRPQKSFKYVNYALIIAALFLLIVTRSRASILALFVLLVVIYLFKDRRVLKNALVFGLSCVLFGIITYAVMPERATLDLYKNYILKYDSSESISSSRGNMYADRILGIAAKPGFGWGYGIKPQLTNSLTGVEKLNDTEKGNSYLAVIEEIGVWMGVMFLLIFFTVIFQCVRYTAFTSDVYRRASGISLGIIFAGVVHASFESWLFYYGSFTANYYWLTLLSHRSLRNASE